MKHQTPLTKYENYELYHRGYFGNHLQFWTGLHEFYQDVNMGRWDKSRPVALRTKTVPGIVLPNYCSRTPVTDVPSLANHWVRDFDINYDDIVINEIGPDDKIVLQGEIMRSERHYDLHFSTLQMVMRPALKYGAKSACGLAALNRVKSVMDTPSFDNLQRLFDEFPEAVIEFSTYSVGVGNLNLNTVFWEVRNY